MTAHSTCSTVEYPNPDTLTPTPATGSPTPDTGVGHRHLHPTPKNPTGKQRWEYYTETVEYPDPDTLTLTPDTGAPTPNTGTRVPQHLQRTLEGPHRKYTLEILHTTTVESDSDTLTPTPRHRHPDTDTPTLAQHPPAPIAQVLRLRICVDLPFAECAYAVAHAEDVARGTKIIEEYIYDVPIGAWSRCRSKKWRRRAGVGHGVELEVSMHPWRGLLSLSLRPIRHLLLSRTRVTLIHLCSLVPVLRPFQALQSISHRNGAGITQRALDKWPAAWDQKGWEEGGTEDYGSLSWGGRDWTLYRSLSSAQMSSPATGISTTTNATPPIAQDGVIASASYCFHEYEYDARVGDEEETVVPYVSVAFEFE
ncbi:hypothetical protein DFP72DRAFT_1081825 [Ephemerocybe angulata]|uniref:Uncharacterized protein n=1 Tax=Ephemerocybe angulata TaxID=980116 RepID=A0A8H6LVC5_9AGAR|nr:hypothetical protein DFP72DRAFT_1081825 [Tulosesus angulatus]